MNGSAAPTLTDEEIDDLIDLWNYVLMLPMSATSDDEAKAALRSFNKDAPAATLAVDMMWAFRMSNYWSKPETWKLGQTMENFLGAWPTIAKQFGAYHSSTRVEIFHT